jgi:hypothetical protein
LLKVIAGSKCLDVALESDLLDGGECSRDWAVYAHSTSRNLSGDNEAQNGKSLYIDSQNEQQSWNLNPDVQIVFFLSLLFFFFCGTGI